MDNTEKDAEINQRKKQSLVEKQIDLLLTLSSDILDSEYGDSVKCGNDCPAIKSVKAYKNLFEKTRMTGMKKHCGIFEKLYNDNKTAIGMGLMSDRWISNPDLIVFVSEDPKHKETCIPLGFIYQTALTVRNRAEAYYKSLGTEDVADKKLIMHRIVLLYMYRIFYFLLEEGEEQKKIGSYVNTLEYELSVENKTIKNSGGSGNDFMKQIMGFTSKIRDTLGIPKVGEDPTVEDISNMISGFMNNKAISDTISTVSEKFKNTNNIGEAAIGLIQDLQTNDAVGRIYKSFTGNNLSGDGGETPDVRQIYDEE